MALDVEDREAASAAPARRPTRPHLARHAPIAAVLAAFAGAAFVLPTLAPVAISDDFLYARSVQILHAQHNVRVLPAAAMTLVFQIGWGGFFAAIFGPSFGVLRAGTVTFALFGGVAMYGLCRELGVNRGRSALGTAAYLFNPLSFVLSYTFMTDIYLVALITMAAYCYVRGMRSGSPDTRWTVIGSVVAGLAFLVRQPGILVVVGVITYLVVSGRLRATKEGLRLLARVALAPALMVVAYGVWFRFIHGVPDRSGQVGVLNAFPDAGLSGIWELSRRLFVLGSTYVGFFVLPVALALIWRLPHWLRRFGTWRWVALGTWIAILAGCAYIDFAPFTPRLPWSPQFVTDRGLGPLDLRGGRSKLVGPAVTGLLLGLALASAAVLVIALVRRAGPLRSGRGAGAGLLAGMGFWLALGVVAPSLPLRNGIYSFDRYFLPLLPLSVALLLWAVRPVRLLMPLAWVVVMAMAIFSVAGTHDHLVYQEAVWSLGGRAHADGVAYADLDAGAAWDGYRLYEYSYRHKVKIDLRSLAGLAKLHLKGPLRLSANDDSPWWIGYYAPVVTQHYIVASDKLFDYVVVRRVEYSSWLRSGPQYMYLLRRPDVAGPP